MIGHSGSDRRHGDGVLFQRRELSAISAVRPGGDDHWTGNSAQFSVYAAGSVELHPRYPGLPFFAPAVASDRARRRNF